MSLDCGILACLSNILLLFMIQRRQSHHVRRNATVDYVHPLFGMYRQAGRGILRHCRDVTSEEVCFCGHHYTVPFILKSCV